MISKIKSVNLLYIIVGVFFIFGVTHLSVPYFWDEIGVYAKAALYMFDNGISLMPDTLPPVVSRGHPVLCSAIFGTAFKIFGPYVWVGRLAALLMSCALLITLFRFTKEYFGNRTAVIACVCLAVQPLFLVQSTMVLPEVMLALFSLLALFYYLNGKFIQLALFSTLAIMVKETAVVLPCCFGLAELAKIYRNGIKKQNIINFCMICMPLFVWGIFLLIQKAENGWYFYPLHAGYISFSPSSILSRLGYYVNYLLMRQGRYMWTIFVAASILLFWWSRRDRQVLKVFIDEYSVNKKWQVSFLLAGYIIVALVVSMLNFNLARYLLFIMPAVCILVACSVDYLLSISGSKMLRIAICMLLFVPLGYLKASYFQYDADFNYLDVVRAQKELTMYLNNIAEEDAFIISDFPVTQGLQEKRAGYTNIHYNNITGASDTEAVMKSDYLVLSSPGSMSSCEFDPSQFKLLETFESAYYKFYLYKNSKKIKSPDII